MTEDWIQIDSYETPIDFLAALWPATNDEWRAWWRKRWVFRGQGDARWGLVPAVLRRGEAAPRCVRLLRAASGKNALTQARQRRIEFRLLKHYLEAADRQGYAVRGDSDALRASHFDTEARMRPSRQWTTLAADADFESTWPADDLIPLLMDAQQAGVPTRLLDWTLSPLVAAFFAAHQALAELPSDGEADDRLAVWAFQVSADTDTRMVGLTRVLEPRTGHDPRLAAQQGVFTLRRALVSGDAEFDDGDVRAIRRLDMAPSFLKLRQLTLPRTGAPELLERLADAGVRHATLFPDRFGLAQDVLQSIEVSTQLFRTNPKRPPR